MGPWLAALLLTGATVEVAPNPCTSSVAVSAAVLARTDAAVRVILVPEGEDLLLTLQAPNHPPQTRPLGLRPGECPLVPELVAVLTERYVRALPAWTWAPRAAPIPPPPAWANTPPRPLGLAGRPRWETRVGLEAGGGAGLPSPDLALRLRGHLVAHHHGGDGPRPGVGVFVAVSFSPRLGFGSDGAITVLAPAAGVTGSLELGRFRATLGLAGGLLAAWARGFERASNTVDPLLEAELRLRATLVGPLYGGLSAQVPLLGHRFTRADEGVARRTAPLTLGLFLGLEQILAFF